VADRRLIAAKGPAMPYLGSVDKFEVLPNRVVDVQSAGADVGVPSVQARSWQKSSALVS
jgi:hypothetical protein